MYVRFALLELNPDTGVDQGVFQVAYKLRDFDYVPAYQKQELARLLRWFDDNLELPIRFNRTKSKGYYRRATKGVSWFKPGATEHLSNMRQIILILEDHGYHVSMVTVHRPGYVVYEDEIQIVAEPFSDIRD